MEPGSSKLSSPPLPSCFSGHAFLAFGFVNSFWLEGIENGSEVREAFFYEETDYSLLKIFWKEVVPGMKALRFWNMSIGHSGMNY